ncbi:hypothetical protein AGMMS4957_14970 [Bacteroidia bacterium]|nr:hypothetical protein AGMMS4957_14970 [Bacteroidia bacterium]
MDGLTFAYAALLGIALVAGIYFTIQDRRAMRESEELEDEENEEVYSEWLHSIRRV